MKYAMFCIAVLLVLAACRKNKDKAPEPEKTPLELLTQNKWLLSSVGWDDNKNKKIDAQEEQIRDCENDNTFEFFTDLTGLAKDNQKTCGTGNPVNNFTWEFTNGNSGMLISSNPATVVTLNKDSLVLLYHIQGLVDGFMAIYKH
jgi:hypothetical protein